MVWNVSLPPAWQRYWAEGPGGGDSGGGGGSGAAGVRTVCLSPDSSPPRHGSHGRTLWDLAPGGGRCFEGDYLRSGSGGEVREFRLPPPPLLLLSPPLASTMELENIVANTVLLKAREGKDGTGGTDPGYRMVPPLRDSHSTETAPSPPQKRLLHFLNFYDTVGRIETGCQRKDAPLSSGASLGTRLRWRRRLVDMLQPRVRPHAPAVVFSVRECLTDINSAYWVCRWGGLVGLKRASSSLLPPFLAVNCQFRQASSTSLTRTQRGCRDWVTCLFPPCGDRTGVCLWEPVLYT